MHLLRFFQCKKNSNGTQTEQEIKSNIKKNKLQRDIKKQLTYFKKYIEKNCEDVGARFPQEARNIHYDKKTSKGIYGKATPEETSELIEEGIDIYTLPWVDDKSEN